MIYKRKLVLPNQTRELIRKMGYPHKSITHKDVEEWLFISFGVYIVTNHNLHTDTSFNYICRFVNPHHYIRNEMVDVGMLWWATTGYTDEHHEIKDSRFRVIRQITQNPINNPYEESLKWIIYYLHKHIVLISRIKQNIDGLD